MTAVLPIFIGPRSNMAAGDNTLFVLNVVFRRINYNLLLINT